MNPLPVSRLVLLVRFVAVAATPAAALSAEHSDWPMYRADASRSGYTAEKLPAALSLVWTYRSPHPPMPAWPGSDRMTFDRAYQPVIAGGLLFFGSSADEKVYALDAATGAVRWTSFTDGPVRFAPVAWQDRVFVAGDDGWLVCLAASDGKPRWRLRGGPKPDAILGSDRMVSRWPARGGPVLADGVLYFAAGIWPSEGVFLYAVDPATGKVLWCNDSSGSIEMDQPHPGARARSGAAAQGYLAAGPEQLFVPTGRAVPAVFQRKTGSLESFPLQLYGKYGGADVAVFDDLVFNHGVLFSHEKGVKPQPLGSQMAVHPEWIVYSKRDRLFALDRRKLWTTSTPSSQRGKTAAAKTLAPAAWDVKLPHEAEAAAIAAGDQVVVGGPDRVSVVGLDSRRVLWTGKVEGTAWGLAVAQGRLYVSTDRGRIYCFQAAAPVGTSAGLQDATTPPNLSSEAGAASAVPAPPGGPSDAFSTAAEEIVHRSGVREGYCLDLGCDEGRLTVELLKRTRLHVFAVDQDAAKVNALRQRLDAMGLYGTRATVHVADPQKLPYPRWFADLVVSGRSVTEGERAVLVAAARRFQRPWGGVACLGRPGAMMVLAAGPLSGAGDWTHQYADAANSLCSADSRLKTPLKVLWFRDTDLVMPNRHGRGPAPLVSQGRMFVEGLDKLRAVNAYNGRTLWEFPLPVTLAPYHQEHLMGVAGTGSNLCMAGERLYLAAGDRCLCLSAADGAKVAEWPAPPRPDGKPATWGFLACEGNSLFGSLADEQHLVKYRFLKSDMSRQFTESVLLFAMDCRTGKVKWSFTPEQSIRHNAIAIGKNRVYLIDREPAVVDEITPPGAQPSAGSKTRPQAGAAGAGTKPPPAEHKPGRLLALDAETGRVLWNTDREVFGTLLALSTRHDILLMSYQSSRFQLDSERGGRLAGIRTSDGARLWDVTAKYISRPILNDRTIYAQPGAWDLYTGRQLPFQLSRSYGCGIPTGCATMLVFRSGTLGYVDLARPGRTENYGGIRPGCWVNAIPAAGLVLMADAASWCTCGYLNQATLALNAEED